MSVSPSASRKKQNPEIQQTISLHEVDPVEILGVHNSRLALIQTYFPEVRITSRGNKLKISGSEEEVRALRLRIERMIQHVQKYGYITENLMMGILTRDPSVEDLLTEEQEDEEVLVRGPGGYEIRPRTENQRRIVEAVRENDIVFVIGPAGTGKTYIAVALAVHFLQKREVRRIILTRPAVEAGEKLGFLPGTLEEKVEPFLRPLYDAILDTMPVERLQAYLSQRTIEIAPLAYMRGRTLDKAFIILDEAQNATLTQLKMFLTRLGPHAKCVITGDLTQIDLPDHRRSGLRTVIHLLEGIRGVRVVQLEKTDVVRHPLVREIVEAFERWEEKEEEEQQRAEGSGANGGVAGASSEDVSSD